MPDKVADGSQFPIFASRRMRAEERERQIGGMAPQAQAIIEKLQPCERPNGGRALHPLSMLQGLSNTDKHRKLHLACLSNPRPTLTTDNVKIERFHQATAADHFGDVLEDRAIIARYRIRVLDPGANVRVDANVAISVTFSDGFPLPMSPGMSSGRSIGSSLTRWPRR